MRIYYQLSSYQGHRIPGIRNIESLRSVGNDIVDHPASCDIVILHDEPWNFPRYFMLYPEMREKYLIAFSVWETDVLPEIYRYNLDLVDEIWTASVFCQKIFLQYYENVHWIPHAVDSPKIDTGELEILKKMIGHDDRYFYFYAITKVDDPRKNWAKLLEMIPRMRQERRIRFVIKTDAVPALETLVYDQQLVLLPFHMSDAMIHALHHIGCCYVSPHCSEGWGLCLADAMAHGNVVVGTGFGGNMDFMTEENSMPVAYRMVPARMSGLWPGFGGRWACVDDGDLVAKMRMCIERWEELTSVRNRAADIVRRFGADVVGELMEKRLRALRSG